MRILYVGDDWVGSNARSLANGFRQAGHDVVVVDSTSVTQPARLSPPWVYSKIAGERPRRTVERVHAKIEAAAADLRPDLLFAFKAIHLDQQRLLSVPARMHVHYSPDDVSNRYNTSPAYLKYESQWDLIITTKRHNVAELIGRGARTVQFVYSAYDPAWHHLSARRQTRQYLVGFIGACRPDRRGSILALGRRYGGELLVRGPGWQRVPALRFTGAAVASPVYGEHYSAAVANVRANLVLLNSDNRDTHTCRTFEVPAAGGLFVGERTSEHAQLLEDKTECLLFAGMDDLYEILEECKADPGRAAKIAESGHRRIVEGGHRYVDRAREIVDELRQR